MPERIDWGGDEFPDDDREIWEEWYTKGRGQEPEAGEVATIPESVIAIEIRSMPLAEARRRIRQLHSDPEHH
jgi:hypothetical protein